MPSLVLRLERAAARVTSLALVVTVVLLGVVAGCAGDPVAPSRPVVAAPGGPRPYLASSPRYRDVSAGFIHTCALTAADSIVCWGSNMQGQITPPADVGYK